MLTAAHIYRYKIIGIYDSYAAIDELFSYQGNDPYMSAENYAFDTSKGGFWDIVVGIGADGKCVTQTILFMNKMGYDRYKRENVLLFEHKEI